MLHLQHEHTEEESGEDQAHHVAHGSKDRSATQIDEELASWTVFYNIKKVLQYKMTDKDKETFEEYKQQLIEDGEIDG